jgi:hypothetical protein
MALRPVPSALSPPPATTLHAATPRLPPFGLQLGGSYWKVLANSSIGFFYMPVLPAGVPQRRTPSAPVLPEHDRPPHYSAW